MKLFQLSPNRLSEGLFPLIEGGVGAYIIFILPWNFSVLFAYPLSCRGFVTDH